MGSLCCVVLLTASGCGGSDNASKKQDEDSSKSGAKTTAKSKNAGGYKGVGQSGTARVTISDGYFVPNKVQVAPGGTVLFINAEDTPHTVTPDKEGSFKAITADQLKASPTGVVVKFPNEGTFAYHCELAGTPGGKYSGTVIVAAPTVTVATTAADGKDDGDSADKATTTATPTTTAAPATTAKN